ncbi:MAG: sigma 54-dependent Fis family transcriptional regulator [Deltaproteobacteria bacterium]|nr:sigma 54-dependent Fis family transcriptional regulator [Deltaproteobacteria bacterium]
MSEKLTVPQVAGVVPVQTLSVSVVSGPDKGKRVVATTDTISIGTAERNDLVLTDETVSRYHLELHHTGNRIQVEDLSSTNGTVSSNVFIQRALVAAGATLQLGNTVVRIEDGELVEEETIDDDAMAGLRGRSTAMRKMMARVQKIAQSDASVLLIGETGVGKEVTAAAVHAASPRRDQPFETVDCGVLSPTLVASELFGHERGAFTGADRQHIGAFERADGGTLFLDEIGELPPHLQTALLGALERRRFRRVGGDKWISINVRVVCATNADLRSAVNAGTFRQDLYYRIAVVLLRIPPLRERLEDIPVLVEHFLREAGHDGPVEDAIPQAAMDALLTHRWQGNIRELRNFVDAALATGEPPSFDDDGAPLGANAWDGQGGRTAGVDGDDRGEGHSAFASGGSSFPSLPLPKLLRLSFKDARSMLLNEFESLYLTALLDRCRQNVSKASRESKIHRSYLNEMLKRHKLR